MPKISPDGRTWRIRVKPGIYFASDPAFGGKRRELTAHDFVYSWKRVVDPRVHSPTVDLLEGKLVGLDAATAKARASGRFDYDTEIEGLKALDRYTLQLTLIEPDYTLLPYLVFPPLRAVAREVVEKYGDASDRVMDHPVGTGPIASRIGDTVRRSCWKPIQITGKTSFRKHLQTLMPRPKRWQQR